jgi:hypothetical protein
MDEDFYGFKIRDNIYIMGFEGVGVLKNRAGRAEELVHRRMEREG